MTLATPSPDTSGLLQALIANPHGKDLGRPPVSPLSGGGEG